MGILTRITLTEQMTTRMAWMAWMAVGMKPEAQPWIFARLFFFVVSHFEVSVAVDHLCGV